MLLRVDGWLAVLGLLLVAVHLSLISTYMGMGKMGISILCYYAVYLVLDQRRQHLSFRAGICGTTLGALAALLTLSNAINVLPKADFLHLMPLMSGISLALLADGIRGFRSYWRELTILFAVSVPRVYFREVIDVSGYTAGFAAFLLWYGGYEFIKDGVVIIMENASVRVDSSCDGVEAMTYLLCLAIVYLILFPTSRRQRWTIVPIAIAIAFVSNALRVAALAVIYSNQGEAAFHHWHEGSASLFWIALPVGIFMLLCLVLLKKNKVNLRDALAPALS